MQDNLKKKAEIVQTALNEFGVELNVVQLAASTRSAQEAAAAVGCTLGQIAKSLVFKGENTQKPILIITSGKNRVNEKAVEAVIKKKLQKANADFVAEQTGFSIGGVPPVGHKNPIPIYIDQDLMQYEEIWAAAGTPNAVFKLTPKILVEITKGIIIPIQ